MFLTKSDPKFCWSLGFLSSCEIFHVQSPEGKSGHNGSKTGVLILNQLIILLSILVLSIPVVHFFLTLT